jgi:hypothetical protein
MERLRNIRRAELDNDLLAPRRRIGGVFEAEVGVEPVCRTGLENLREDDLGEGFRLEEESDKGAVYDRLLDQGRFRELYASSQH